jgi:hypothetical protein
VSLTVSTCNMAEALYLLRRGNRVVSVRMACTWPYGLEECAMVFEGESAEADHDRYIAYCPCVDLGCLPELFAAVTAVLPGTGGRE